MASRKSRPLSIRLEEKDLAKLGARADDLGVSMGALLRNLVTYSLHSEIDVQLEGVRAEISSLQNQAALLRVDLYQLNENLRDALRAILCFLTGDEEQAQEMAHEIVKVLRTEG